MNKEALIDIIRKGIKDALVSKAKGLHNDAAIKKTDSYVNSEEITEDDVDSFLFWGGGEKPEKQKANRAFTIRENMDNNVKITTSEIKAFESSFKEVLDSIQGSTIVFNKQKNGYSIIAIKKPDGIEAIASGIINMGSRGKITWAYSLMNGLTINGQNLKISNSNKGMLEALFNHYDGWQKDWREKLNYPQAGPTGTE
jgi:hypothetical protein